MSKLYLVLTAFADYGGTYGFGETPAEAAKSAIRAGASKRDRAVVWTFPEGTTQSDIDISTVDGSVSWPTCISPSVGRVPLTHLGAIITNITCKRTNG